MKKNIAVITGGEASEVGISLKSADVVCRHLNKDKYNVFKVVIEGNDWIVERQNPVKLKIDKNDFTFTIEGHKITFDGVFMALHGTPAEDGKLQGYFDLLKIPYNACGVLQAARTVAPGFHYFHQLCIHERGGQQPAEGAGGTSGADFADPAY